VKVSRWRVAAGVLVLAILVLLGARLFPIYLHNLELQQFVEGVTHRPSAYTTSDDLLRTWVLGKAAQLGLPVHADNVRIARESARLSIDVRYEMRVDLPLYTVNLHFYPGAGSR
jgi:hypothetical protein